jgi:hypothetical protein
MKILKYVVFVFPFLNSLPYFPFVLLAHKPLHPIYILFFIKISKFPNYLFYKLQHQHREDTYKIKLGIKKQNNYKTTTKQTQNKKKQKKTKKHKTKVETVVIFFTICFFSQLKSLLPPPKKKKKTEECTLHPLTT